MHGRYGIPLIQNDPDSTEETVTLLRIKQPNWGKTKWFDSSSKNWKSMASLLFIAPFITVPNCNLCSKIHGSSFRIIANPTLNFLSASFRPEDHLRFASIHRSHSHSSDEEEDSQEGLVQDLRVPEHWLDPSKALEESEWLRVTLHKWLDDEYCPEPTNVDISCVAARSYYKSLVERQTDLGEILLKMARELESISYQESFHGAFSSANAAVNLIIQRIEQD